MIVRTLLTIVLLLVGVELEFELLELIKVENIFSIGLVNLAIGFVVAGISGYLSINWLIKLIDKSHFWKFSFFVISLIK